MVCTKYVFHLNDDVEIKDLLEVINDDQSRVIANAEREVLKILEGDCNTPVGAFSKIEGDNINLSVELFSVDGKKRYFKEDVRNKSLAKELLELDGIFFKKVVLVINPVLTEDSN